MANMRGQYEKQVQALHEKLLWYADNQKLLTDNESRLSDQSRVIAELRGRLEAGGVEASQSKISDLQEQVCSVAAMGAQAPCLGLVSMPLAVKAFQSVPVACFCTMIRPFPLGRALDESGQMHLLTRPALQ
jgi:hypothetical protein